MRKAPLDFDACLTESIADGTISKSESNKIIDYMKSASEDYWEMHWKDIEEENGLTPDEAGTFAQFYNKYKKHEVVDGSYRWILFDCSVYS